MLKPQTESSSLLPKSAHAHSLSYLQATGNIIRFSLPFTISRVAVAANVLANGSVTPTIGADAAAAGPLMISVVYAVLGPGRSILLSTGILIGKKYGEVQALLKAGNNAEASRIQVEIGTQLRQSFLFGTGLGLVSMGIMIGMGPILQTTGLNENIVHEVEGFLNSTAVGMLPIYWSTSDQQFGMATGHKYIPMVFGTLFPILSMAIGYPLALGLLGLPKLGTVGLGAGMAAAAWLSFISLRCYFLKSEFAPYQIYKMSLQGITNQFSELLKLGMPLGFQALTEWGNLFALSNLVGNKGFKVSMAANGSFQIITAATLITAALGQGISVKISEQLGKMKIADQLEQYKDVMVINNNIKRLGNAGIITGTIATAALTAVLCSLPKQIQSMFISHDDKSYEEILLMSQAILMINAIGLIADTIRNMSASALGGSKDVMFAPIISLVTMSVLALSIGGIVSNYLDYDANWLFITRDIGILAAAVGISAKWLMKSHVPQATATHAKYQEIVDSDPGEFRFFSKSTRTSLPQPDAAIDLKNSALGFDHV